VAALMIQGCGSYVGKSVLVAGLCRLFTHRGLRVRPFKSQNMSNNAAVTEEGGEIGRAQALQARACRVPPSADMNPILLKPQSGVGAQLIVRGRMAGTVDAAAYKSDRSALLNVALESYRKLEREAQLIVIEGAGSPAEINLRKGDIANMGLARELGVPVILVGDIDRGHVIASLVGTHVVLDDEDRALIQGFIINKFRGRQECLGDGVARIVQHTGWRCIGIVPWLAAADKLPAEDSVALEQLYALSAGNAGVRIVVPQLPHIANFDDFDPLEQEPEVELTFVPPGKLLPPADLIILPGTKSTIADLDFLREQGWDIDVLSHVRRGGRVLGICGGYQMLGRSVSDAQGIEGPPRTVAGLGLLPVDTLMLGAKALREVGGWMALNPETQASFTGYEMHLGVTTGKGTDYPLVHFDDGTFDGAVSQDGKVAGCYVHGLFAHRQARSALLSLLGAAPSIQDHSTEVDAALDEIAKELEGCLDIGSLAKLAGL
jgi:adenosylcobyric acid synthase